MQVGTGDLHPMQLALQHGAYHISVTLFRNKSKDERQYSWIAVACLLGQINRLIIDQAGLAQPGGHQNDRALAVDIKRQQRIRIADRRPSGRRPFSRSAASALSIISSV